MRTMWKKGYTVWWKIGIIAVICFSLLSCGKEGPPRPKVIDLPKPPGFTLLQQGDKGLVTFPFPFQKTSGAPIAQGKLYLYCYGMGLSSSELPPPPDPRRWAGEKHLCETLTFSTEAPLRSYTLPLKIPEGYAYGALFITVRSEDEKHRLSPYSATKGLLILPTLPVPQAFQGKSQKEGLELTWKGEGCETFLLTKEPGKVQKTLQENHWLDKAVQTGQTYIYYLYCQKDETHRSKPATLKLTYQDTFPPPAPTQVVWSPLGEEGRLSWQGSPDARGYRIYKRCGEKEPWIRVAETENTYHILPVEACLWAVSAVDAAGNESEKTPAQ